MPTQQQAAQAAQAVAQAAVQQQQRTRAGEPSTSTTSASAATLAPPELPLDCSRFLAQVEEQELRHMRMLSHLCSQTYYMGRLTVRGQQQHRTVQ